MVEKHSFLKKTLHSKAFCCIILIGVILLLNSVLVSSAQFDNRKSFDSEIGTYGKVEIRNWFGLTSLEDIELKTNTEICNGNNCEATHEIIMYSKGKLIDDVRFYDLKDNNTITKIESYKIQYKLNGKWIDYNYEEVEKGTYEVRLIGELNPFQKVDWQIKSQGMWIEEWAVWTSGLNVGIKAAFNFDVGTGSSLPNVNESSIHNGTLHNMEEADWVTGLLDKALSFGGTDEWIGNFSEPTNITDWSENYTISVWLKPTNTELSYTLSSMTSSDNAGEFMLRQQADGTFQFVSQLGSHTANHVSTTSTYPTTSWTNILIQSYSNGTMRIYNNGTLEDETVSLYGSWGTTGETALTFGRAAGEPEYYTGLMDEINIWDRILTDTEITQLYNEGGGITYAATGTTTVSVNLISPIDSLSTTLTLFNFTSNASITLGNLTNATLSVFNSSTAYFGTNFTTINGTENTTRFSLDGFNPGNYIWNVEYCGTNTTDTFCSSATTNRTFLISSFTENSQTINANSTETKIETFAINITYDDSIYTLGTGILNYNGTNYLGTSTKVGSNTIFTRSLTVPSFSSNQTIPFNWKFSFTGLTGTFISNSSLKNQSVQVLNASRYNIPYTTPFINFTIYDEKTLAVLNSTFSSTFSYGVNYTTETVSHQDISGLNSTFSFAFDPSTLSYLISGDLEYSAPLYVTKLYSLPEQRINATTTQIDLYLLNSSISTSFIIKVRDSSYSSVPNAIVHTQRYYPSTNTWLTVEVLTTNSEGKALGHFTTEDVNYRFLVYVGNSLVLTSTPTKIYCEATPCTITLTIPSGAGGYETYGNLTDFDYTLSYSKTTEDFTYSYVDTDTTANGGTLKVIYTNLGNASETTVCDTYNAATTAIITCDITGLKNGTYVAFAYNNRTTGSLVNTLVISKVRNIVAEVGVDGVLWAVFFLMSIVMLGLFKPAIAITFAVVGLVMISLLGLISIPWIALVSIILLALIILWEMRTV